MEPDACIARLRESLAKTPGIRLGVLFGSVATGRSHRGSDVDVAVLFDDDDITLAAELDLQARLTAVCRRTVDVVRLDRASTVLRWEVARHGVLLCGAAGELAAFQATAAADYIDFVPALQAAVSVFRRRLQRGGQRGGAPAMTDANVLARKLTLLQEHVGRLRRRRPPDVERLRADTDLQDAIAMSLVVAVQTALDVALHVAADEGWGVPGTYGDAFALLAEHRVLDQDTAQRLGGMAALRNRLAHGYVTVDFPRLWQELPDGIAAFERFAAAVAKYLRPGGPAA